MNRINLDEMKKNYFICGIKCNKDCSEIIKIIKNEILDKGYILIDIEEKEKFILLWFINQDFYIEENQETLQNLNDAQVIEDLENIIKDKYKTLNSLMFKYINNNELTFEEDTSFFCKRNAFTGVSIEEFEELVKEFEELNIIKDKLNELYKLKNINK